MQIANHFERVQWNCLVRLNSYCTICTKTSSKLIPLNTYVGGTDKHVPKKPQADIMYMRKQNTDQPRVHERWEGDRRQDDMIVNSTQCSVYQCTIKN